MSHKINHLILFPLSNASHLRPCVNLGLHILLLHPSLVITTVIPSSASPVLATELERQDERFLAEIRYAERWRTLVVKVASDLPPDSSDIEPLREGLRESGLLKRVLQGKEGAGDWLTKPCFIIADVGLSQQPQYPELTRSELGQTAPPVYIHWPLMAFATARWLVPESEGGPYEHCHDRYLQYRSEGLLELEAEIKASRAASGQVVSYPGLPPVYDYEFTPQTGSRDMTGRSLAEQSIYHLLRNGDGILEFGIDELDREAREFCRKMIAPRDIVGCGLQVQGMFWQPETETSEAKQPTPFRQSAATQDQKAEDKRILDFLDRQLKQHGPASVAYISLGSLRWPERRPELVNALVDTFLATTDLVVPFVLVVPSFAKPETPESFRRRIEPTGRGVVTSWAPQVDVLKHEATGVFLTHGGAGSFSEAVITQTPLIFMPQADDQPAFANLFSRKYRVGVQLYQFASGCDGEPRMDGPVVHSTPEAMKDELTRALRTTLSKTDSDRSLIGGIDRASLLKNMEWLHNLFVESARTGQARNALLSLNKFFRKADDE